MGDVMAYGGQPGQNGQQRWPGDDGGSRPPQWGYRQQDDTRGPGRYGQRGHDGPGQQADAEGRWQPPEWRYGRQRRELGNGHQWYEPGQPQPGPLPAWTAQPGQQGFGSPSSRPPYRPPQRGRSWPARHKALTGLLAFVALIIIVAAARSGGSPSSPGRGTAAGLTTITTSAAATETPSHPATRAAATVQQTQPERTQTAVAATQAPAPAPPEPAPTTPAHTTPAPSTPAAVVAPPTSAAPAGCHPLTNAGKCYEPGEFCRAADHGASGLAGDGEAITCEDNDGWRWEPS
jgi:hypothetical protein